MTLEEWNKLKPGDKVIVTKNMGINLRPGQIFTILYPVSPNHWYRVLELKDEVISFYSNYEKYIEKHQATYLNRLDLIDDN